MEGSYEGINLADRPMPTSIPDDHNIGDGLAIMTWVMLAASTVLIGARMVSKTFILRRFRIDDIFLLLTWLGNVVYSVMMQLAYHNGFGRHSLFLSLPAAVRLLKWVYVGMHLAILTPMLGRIAVGLYTLSLLGVNARWLKFTIWFLISQQAVHNIAISITLLCACGTDITQIANPVTTCFRQSTWSRYAEFVGGWNAATDGALTLAPIVLIWGLRTTRRAKWGASILLGFSSLAMAAAIWRTAELDKIFIPDWDFTYNAVLYFYASSFEQSTILIAASIPTLGPIFKHYRSRTNSKFSAGSNGSLSYGTSSRQDSNADKVQIQKNLAHALGIEMPGLGNTVVICAGGKDRLNTKGSQESVMQLSNIKATRSTDVKVESAPAYTFYSGDEDVERLFSTPKAVSDDGAKR